MLSGHLAASLAQGDELLEYALFGGAGLDSLENWLSLQASSRGLELDREAIGRLKELALQSSGPVCDAQRAVHHATLNGMSRKVYSGLSCTLSGSLTAS
jgi:hypothetical protein